MSKSPEQLVLDFGALWDRQDIEGIVNAMSEDCVYANVPIPAMHGHEAVRQFITPTMVTASGIEWKFLSIATAGDGRTVLTERIDTFHFGDKRVDVPLMGIFVLKGDKISEWRDYSDIGTFIKEMAAIGKMPGPGLS